MSVFTPEKITPRSLAARRVRKAAELEARTRLAAERLHEVSALPAASVLRDLAATRQGLDHREAAHRLHSHGRNTVAEERAPRWFTQLAKAYANPFIGVLVFLAAVMYWQDPADPGVVILSTMVAISGLLRFWQEYRSGRAADALKKLVTTTTAVQRRAGRGAQPTAIEVPMDQVVPGDVVKLGAGDLIPADLRLLSAKDLMVSQAALSGESLPVAKADTRADDQGQQATSDPAEADNLCLMGTSVTSGTATGVVVATGEDTYFGSMAGSLVGERPQTNFDNGVRRVSFLLIRFMLVMVPVVFAVNGLTKGDWDEAFLFAIAVAVGLTPEMLPMVVSANLARGAVAMSRKKVVVKRLNAIQNLGAMDVLCTDKTGTLTEDRIALDRHLDVHGREDTEVLEYGYLNAHFQTGLKNLMDQAVIDRVVEAEEVVVDARFSMVDEIPFDFARRRMSVVLNRNVLTATDGWSEHVLITKGAVEEVLALCTHMTDRGERVELTERLRRHVSRIAEDDNRQGLRVLAVATRTMAEPRDVYGVADETELTLVGFLAFLDPPKQDAAAALKAWPTRASPSRWSPATTSSSPPASAPTSAWRSARSSPAPTSTCSTRPNCVNWPPVPPCSPRSTRSRRPVSCAPSRPTATRSASSATASTTPPHCATPTSASPSTPPSTSPRSPPTSSCWRRTSPSWSRAFSRAVRPSGTRSSTSR